MESVASVRVKSVEVHPRNDGDYENCVLVAELLIVIEHGVPYLSFPRHLVRVTLGRSREQGIRCPVDSLSTGKDHEHVEGTILIDYPKVARLVASPERSLPYGNAVGLFIDMVGFPGEVPVCGEQVELIWKGKLWGFGS
jgi:hypothetical protein